MENCHYDHIPLQSNDEEISMCVERMKKKIFHVILSKRHADPIPFPSLKSDQIWLKDA